MADQKISDMTNSFPLTGTEYVPVVQIGQNYKTTTQDIANLAAGLPIAKLSLSSAQILALNGTPITIIAAPGAGKLIMPIRIVINKTFNSVSYTTNLNLVLGAGTVFASTFSNALGFSASEIAGYSITSNASASPASGSINVALQMSVATGNPAAGNSTIDIYLLYQVITL